MGQRNPWTHTAAAWSSLGFESAMVIGLRLAKLAEGGPAAAFEAQRMVNEKTAAMVEAQWGLALAMATGASHHRAGHKTLALYRRKVRANRRRLSRTS